jgi:hypothetical protein
MTNDTSFVTFDQIEVALRATTPPLKWSKASLIRIGRRDHPRLPHIRPGSRLEDPVWERDAIVRFVRCNHPNQSELVRDFTEALDAEIAKAAAETNATPRKRTKPK